MSCASITPVTNVLRLTDEANVIVDEDIRVLVPAVATADDDDALDPDRARTNGNSILFISKFVTRHLHLHYIYFIYLHQCVI